MFGNILRFILSILAYQNPPVHYLLFYEHQEVEFNAYLLSRSELRIKIWIYFLFRFKI